MGKHVFAALRRIARLFGVRRPVNLIMAVKSGALRPGLPYALVVSQEASRTADSILAAQICRELNQGYNVMAMLLGGGELVENFRQSSHVLIGPYPKGSVDMILGRAMIRALRAKLPIDFAIVSGLASGPMLRPLAEIYAPTVFLVHEFDKVDRGPDGISESLASAGVTVLTSEALRETALAGQAEIPVLAARVLSPPSGISPQASDPGTSHDVELSSYVKALVDLAQNQQAELNQLRSDVKFLAANKAFDDTFFLPPNTDLTREQAALKFAKSAQNGVFLRKPQPGFYPARFIDQAKARPHVNPFRAFLQSGAPKGSWQIDCIDLSAEPKPLTGTLRVAVHVHAFYPHALERILQLLRRQIDACDLFLSVPSKEGAALARQLLVQGWTGRTVIRQCPNRGRDIGPFVTGFGKELQSYDVVGHFHTKNSAHLQGSPALEDWLRYLTENLLGRKYEAARSILARFASDAQLGMVFPEDPNLIGWGKNLPFALPLAKRLGTIDLPSNAFPFPVGTMFWARPAALAPLFNLNLDWQDYPQEPVSYDGTLLHALERMLPSIVEQAGYKIATTFTPGVRR